MSSGRANRTPARAVWVVSPTANGIDSHVMMGLDVTVRRFGPGRAPVAAMLQIARLSENDLASRSEYSGAPPGRSRHGIDLLERECVGHKLSLSLRMGC